MHWVLLETLSIGVLLIGDAGIGSAAALEIVRRGHRTVAEAEGTYELAIGNLLEARLLSCSNIWKSAVGAF